MFGKRLTRALAVVAATMTVMAGTTFADGIAGDTDALATAAPAANGLDADQTIGTTDTYDYSAYIKETGNAGDDVFLNSGDTVGATVVITQNDLSWPASVDTQFNGSNAFTAYDPQNKAGLLSVTVPSSASVSDINHIKVEITATASNGQSMSPNTVTLNYNITATAPVGCTYTASFLAPIDQSTSSGLMGNTFKKGRVIPVKAIVYCNGTPITPYNSSLIPWISVTEAGFLATASDAVESFSDAGSSSAGTQDFRWVDDLSVTGGGYWIYNLDTSKSFVVGKTYNVYVNVDTTQITSTWAVLVPKK
jgi:hypothetical protein